MFSCNIFLSRHKFLSRRIHPVYLARFGMYSKYSMDCLFRVHGVIVRGRVTPQQDPRLWGEVCSLSRNKHSRLHSSQVVHGKLGAPIVCCVVGQVLNAVMGLRYRSQLNLLYSILFVLKGFKISVTNRPYL